MPDHRKASDPTIVLKFGGSVLHNEQRLGLGVHEIYRWRREGYRVIAVVSALAGETESLIELAARIAPDASSTAVAAVIGHGESKSAALLGLLLERSGQPARVLSPAALRFACAGDGLDAHPCSIDTGPIEAALAQDGIVVIPGFVGVDEHARTVTLGRGGSDTTAVFLAGAIGAQRCRLIKDVDGLYEADPSRSPHARRYTHASYNDALRTDGSIIQHKSISLARSLGVEIELGRFNAVSPTIIGNHPSNLTNTRDRPPQLRIAICGLGTVGGGLVELLQPLREDFEIVGASCRSPQKHANLAPLVASLGSDSIALAQGEADVLVEAIGGIDLPRRIVETAIRSGKHVITANKALIAEHGEHLHALAHQHDVHLLYAASVGGGLPVLERLRGHEVISVSGILNGTSHFVLHSLANGVPYPAAVEQAQRLGFAESDPSRDLDGRDALDKLRVIALCLGWSGYETEPPDCDPTGIEPGSGAISQIAHISPLRARVRLQQLDGASPYAKLGPADNLVEIELLDGRRITIHGKSAGRYPTAESVLSDLLGLSRTIASKACCVNPEEHAHA